MNEKSDSVVECFPVAIAAQYAHFLEAKVYSEPPTKESYLLDVAQLIEWSRLNRGREFVPGVEFYEKLQDENLLPHCLGLAEIIAIEFRGNSFHDKYFKGKRVIGWKDAVRRPDHQIRVPFLDKGLNLYRGWFWLGGSLRSNAPAFLTGISR